MKKMPLLVTLIIGALPPVGATSAHAGRNVSQESRATQKAQPGAKKKALTRSATSKLLASRAKQAFATARSATDQQYTATRSTPDRLSFNNAEGVVVATASALVVKSTPMVEIAPTGNTRLTDVTDSAVPMATAAASSLKLKSGKHVPLLVSTRLVSKRLAAAYDAALRTSTWNNDTGFPYDAEAFNKATFDLVDALEQEFPALKAAGYDFVKSARRGLGVYYRSIETTESSAYIAAAYDLSRFILVEPAETYTRDKSVARTFRKLTSLLLGNKPTSILDSYEDQ